MFFYRDWTGSWNYFSKDGKIRPDDDWKLEVDQKDQPSIKLLTTGAGGLLYPVRLLNLDFQFQ